MKVQALITVCAVELSSMLNILSLGSIISWLIFSLFSPLSNYLIFCYWTTVLVDYFFKLGDCFSFKVAKCRWGIFFNFEHCRPNYTSKRMMQQWKSYCLQWSLGPGWSVWGTYNSVSNDYSSTFVQAISLTRPLCHCAPAIRAKHQLLSFEHFASQQKTVFSWGVDKIIMAS